MNTAPTLPAEPTGYHQFWRAPGVPLWRALLVAVLSMAAYWIVTSVASMVAMSVEVASGAIDAEQLRATLEGGGFSPGIVLGNSLGLGVLLPIILLIALLARQPLGFLHSVAGRFRWRWFFVCLGLAGLGLGLAFVWKVLAAGAAEGLRIQPFSWWLLAGLMLVTPFQAAAEEYLFRGVFFRTVASWFRRPAVALIVGTLVNTALFTAMHAAEDLWLNVFYVTLAAVLSYLTWRTGGIEAAVAVHVVNNMIGFAVVPFQDLSSVFDRSAGVGGPTVAAGIIALVVVGVLIDLAARRSSTQRLGPQR
ncbi:MAG: CPBP family intramembrane metalloprotease [Propionibacteriaceae bacterium]|nr:CPBP family intramembrane metalloprotease [Propionibacteriaceae bacterium]